MANEDLPEIVSVEVSPEDFTVGESFYLKVNVVNAEGLYFEPIVSPRCTSLVDKNPKVVHSNAEVTLIAKYDLNSHPMGPCIKALVVIKEGEATGVRSFIGTIKAFKYATFPVS